MKTKAVTNKAIYDNCIKYDLTTSEKPNTILGIWITDHKFKSKKNNEDLEIKGEYEVNVWYSYSNDTKTNIATRKIEYNEIIPKIFNQTSNYSIKLLGNPSCSKESIEDDVIIVEIFKQFEIEVIDEIEIIEDKPKKIQKMTLKGENIGYGVMKEWLDFTPNDNEQKICSAIEEIGIKINELIEQVNYLGEKSDKEC